MSLFFRILKDRLFSYISRIVFFIKQFYLEAKIDIEKKEAKNAKKEAMDSADELDDLLNQYSKERDSLRSDSEKM